MSREHSFGEYLLDALTLPPLSNVTTRQHPSGFLLRTPKKKKKMANQLTVKDDNLFVYDNSDPPKGNTLKRTPPSKLSKPPKLETEDDSSSFNGELGDLFDATTPARNLHKYDDIDLVDKFDNFEIKNNPSLKTVKPDETFLVTHNNMDLFNDDMPDLINDNGSVISDSEEDIQTISKNPFLPKIPTSRIETVPKTNTKSARSQNLSVQHVSKTSLPPL